MGENDRHQVQGFADHRELIGSDTDGGVEEFHAHRRDYERHDHGRDQQPHEKGLERQPAVAQSHRGDGPEQRSEDGGKNGDDDAVLDRQVPDVGFFADEEVLVPAQAESRHGIGEVRLGVERQRDDHQNRRDQKYQDGAADDPEGDEPGAAEPADVGGQVPQTLDRRSHGDDQEHDQQGVDEQLNHGVSPASCCRCRRACRTARRRRARRRGGTRRETRRGPS